MYAHIDMPISRRKKLKNKFKRYIILVLFD
jgi:hypothetical protein